MNTNENGKGPIVFSFSTSRHKSLSSLGPAFENYARKPLVTSLSVPFTYIKGESYDIMYFSVNQNLWGTTTGNLENRHLADPLLLAFKFSFQ